MALSRRQFIGIAGGSTGGAILASLGLSAKPKAAHARRTKDPEFSRETTSICPYCGVGCGLIVSTQNGKVTNVEGDPDHPINEGALCPKGSAVYQVATSDRRLGKVLYRAAGSDHWEEKGWEWAVPQIARRVKATRDATFTELADGRRVNRTDGIACLGGAALDNEECYLLSKFARALGLVYLEHQARI